MNTALSAPALRQARLRLLERGDCPSELLGERLARSWRRSMAAGLLPSSHVNDDENLCGGHLLHALAHQQELLAHARPVMDYLFEQVRHSRSMVVLADHQGVLMRTLGDADFLDKAERVALSAGVSWHERQRGTNAIGTALAENAAVEVHGAEHYLERNAFLTCAAAPILSASGELLGVLDISGDQRRRHPHTLGLVNTAARMIENRLLLADERCRFRLHLHAHAEGIGSVAEGIVALSEDGWIIGANRAALSLLRLTPADLGRTPLTQVFDSDLETLLAHSRRQQKRPMQQHLRDGSPLFVEAHGALSPVGRASVCTSDGAAETRDDALSRLDTGDTRWHGATEKVRRILGKPIPLLIHGESGVGKELLARAAHDSGPRQQHPFVAINCAAIPENLIEAELFGYLPGAFTGARREGSPGRLREAHGGTLFLDEIGDMPLLMQSRLLRVLQERQVVPLGGSVPIDVDFALVCATHRTLRDEVERGNFRSDLYYRINGLTLHLPALRERSDFSALSERLLRDLCPQRRLHVAPDLFARLVQYRWPGNLRQYASVLRTACAMLDEDECRIDWPHLPDDVSEELRTIAADAPAVKADGGAHNLAQLSRLAIRQALETCQGNISQAARRLGISRQTLYRKLHD
ncbi:sigma-54-dependent Fis family transcriptional regulator [Rhodocyclus gracilis]|uniref:GAF domain-containing protein n=1 Tax=Rhodocyclus tenuis TaxID=1066 RepID=A0A6L5JUQ6_RHOTE|nr:sigma-54-dependent Fis family transcriptional regulator [Rhodocyclus gracilis]MQY50334.1 GAF domain-containing protein [Rhodocyclus gracilis]